ncbi:MAG: SBBP repeat-containing protein, partial [Candidatus Aminicenantes bacterium]|nr:SBBP repeat-containing protein [Candidatus Aminicenantes bacterium]
MDRSGNVFVTGFSNAKCTTIKYDSKGKRRWLGQLSGEPNAIAADADGNVYVTGCNHDGASSWDFFTVKYDNDGKQRWLIAYNGPANDGDKAAAIAVDDSGNVYVTGYSEGSNGKKDVCSIKYDAAGKQKWVKRYNGPANGDDEARAIAVDGSGNVYVTGRSERPKTGRDFVTIKYNAAGLQKWVKHFSGPGDDDDSANSLALDASGGIYVTGTIRTPLMDADCATLKYNAAGKLQWLRRHNGPSNRSDRGIAVAVDTGGRVCVAATSAGLANDFAVLQYTSAGAEQWASRYNGPSGGQDEVAAMAVDGSGNVFVTGYSWSATEADYATVKYDAAGV